MQRGLIFLAQLFFALLLLSGSQPVLAVGTSAGVDISSRATVDYTIAGASGITTSAPVVLRVGETIDLTVSWQDGANVAVNSPDTGRVIHFLLSNTGNGNDSYTLDVLNTLTGDQFNPAFVSIYLDADGNGLFDSATDTLYTAGNNDPVLAADTSLAIFVLNNIPPSLNSGDLGNSQLNATSNTLSGTPGTSLAGAGENNSVAVVGNSGGTANDTATYIISGTAVALVKSVIITDPLGGNRPVTGATLRYRIDVTVTGPGTANGLVITDPIPTNTTYVAGSLRLNAIVLTDAQDGDNGDVGSTNANTVTVNLGDLAPASPTQSIYFDVTIN